MGLVLAADTPDLHVEDAHELGTCSDCYVLCAHLLQGLCMCLQQDEAAKVQAKKQQVADSVVSMAAALQAADARRQEAALAPPKPAAAQAATAAPDNAGEDNADGDAAAPMQTDAADDVQEQDAGVI